jgi:protoporphyrinogen oxidase
VFRPRECVIIIGAGPAGLTAAYELASKRYTVRVLEADPQYVGGLARVLSQSFSVNESERFSATPAHSSQ